MAVKDLVPVMGIVRIMRAQVESPARFAALELRSGKFENSDGIRQFENGKSSDDAYRGVTGTGSTGCGQCDYSNGKSYQRVGIRFTLDILINQRQEKWWTIGDNGSTGASSGNVVRVELKLY